MNTLQPEPFLLMVFGGTGDLMRRKLLPALYRLSREGGLGERWQIVAVGRSQVKDEDYRSLAAKVLNAAGLGTGSAVSDWCSERVHYRPMGRGSVEEMMTLGSEVKILEQRFSLANRAFYLALPPNNFPGIITSIGDAGLHHCAGWSRIVIEKPFGRDLASAQELNRLLWKYLNESQIFRIDHYQGKETVQNLLVLRFANPIFETLWNRDRVDSVQITVAETLGIEHRAAYYEQAGALRDMVQNHLTQLLCLIAMEIPGAFDPESIRDEKSKVLRSIPALTQRDVVFGQYVRAMVAGQEVAGYRKEPGVAPDSRVETFVALKLAIENWRWQGVPFYLRVGKRLPRHVSQIVINFRCPPVLIFQPHRSCKIHGNALVVTLQPDEGFDICFEVKQPGESIQLQTERLHFRYAEAFAPIPDAYQTLLRDMLLGDQTLFVRADWTERSWSLYTPILGQAPEPFSYEAGTWGPPAADELLALGGHQWFPL